ncbi:BfmA/BtgA family mobilization protein [Hymenobacter sp. BT770]|uniref:BfmA/BtgA family mobilization protein n=1 Tax=Hymenobacter sp. BT770 TaxID=2886942 RepID=UPI001D10B55D|nr:BfmA/BtgA family mobilization protein [Hymenobacter sp. BT770]MCC3155217.1 hypothetical protein [Hymenobacter sp. BT770]MDO3417172.1 BfmA/BtgA family mobilization protein [Hymenobacter sp. BT770]
MDKTIRADEAAYEGFRQLAKECQLSNPELLAAMVQYFRVTKADPRQPTGLDLTSSLAKITAKLADLDKRTIGFIREQEKTYLKPILAEVQAVHNWTTGPNTLTEPQLLDMEHWLTVIIRKGFKPEYRNPAVANDPLPSPKGWPELEPLRQLLRKLLIRELIPDQFVRPAQVPAPAAASPSPPATPTLPAP